MQFEDFETNKAIPLLNKYRDTYRCFNDDIQGTGCVTLAGLVAAARQASPLLYSHQRRTRDCSAWPIACQSRAAHAASYIIMQQSLTMPGWPELHVRE